MDRGMDRWKICAALSRRPKAAKGWTAKCLCGPSCVQAEPRGRQLLSHALLPVAGRLQTSCIVLLSPAAAAAELLLRSHMQGGRGSPPAPSQKPADPPGSIRLEARSSLPGRRAGSGTRSLSLWCLSPRGKLSASLPELQRDWCQKKSWQPVWGSASRR